MRALLLIAHGSRRAASNDEVRELAKRLEGIGTDRFDKVVPAFLELADPDIPSGVGLCSEAGVKEVVVMPYFLSAGRHVAEDIPEELAKAAGRYPGVEIKLCGHIGQHPAMAGLLLQAAEDA